MSTKCKPSIIEILQDFFAHILQGIFAFIINAWPLLAIIAVSISCAFLESHYPLDGCPSCHQVYQGSKIGLNKKDVWQESIPRKVSQDNTAIIWTRDRKCVLCNFKQTKTWKEKVKEDTYQ
jgi:hypothetical protein